MAFMDTAVLQEEALLLSEGDRALLADRLLESLSCKSEALSSAWTEESEERLNAFKNGEIRAKDGIKVLEELRNRVS